MNGTFDWIDEIHESKMGLKNRLQHGRPRNVLASGLLIGFFIGATSGMFGICYVHLTPSPSELGELTRLVDTCEVSSDRLFGSFATAFGTAEPTRSLRLLQGIGILLPLFTGLLRFTTDSSSEVSSSANGLLFLGIVGLVLGGIAAAVSGIFTSTALILKIALSFVIITFFIIAGVASKMLNEMAEWTERETNSGQNSQLGIVGVNLEAGEQVSSGKGDDGPTEESEE